MIELREDALVFSFPRVHPEARFVVSFQRTLRVPDDGKDYPLPAGLGRFPLEHVDDHAARVPESWRRHGGVMLPMHRAEALWIDLGTSGYPMAVKVAAGKVNAVNGEAWSMRLSRGRRRSLRAPRASAGPRQHYLVLPEQPWLDGFNVGTGVIRQFVAMPLGEGYTAEEQLTGGAEHGGLQLLAYPMKAEAYDEWRRDRLIVGPSGPMEMLMAAPPPGEMGLGAGGRIRQSISADVHDPDVWDLDHPARCFVHLVAAQDWEALTGQPTPTRPPSPSTYRTHGIPWFDYDAPGRTVPGSSRLDSLDSVAALAKQRRTPLPDDVTVPVDRVIHLGRRPVRDGEWS